jgi:hypothetical protein
MAKPNNEKEGVVAIRASGHSRPDHSGGRKVKFGEVTFTGKAPSSKHVQRSTEGLEHLAERLEKRGVALRAEKGVPLLSLASDDPDVMIRTLDGKTERGRIVVGVSALSRDLGRRWNPRG